MSLDPVTLSVLASALSGIAEEAGAVLIRGAYSSNIKERRDCSAALFDASGAMVAQAEHIPVHLGAMPEAVAAVIEHEPEVGDVWIVNDPYRGGTHLPDITLVSPLDIDGDILAYAVTRAHHSDVGGMRPGSMPADSTDVYQEGIVIPPLRLGDDVLELILANVRTPAIRRGDLRAQTAANRLAGRRLEELVERRGRDVVEQAFEEVVAYAERRTREALREVPDGTYEAERAMEGDGVSDDDVRIAVTVTVDGDALAIDFSGTADQVAGNVNCPLSVTRSACYFALRALLPSDVPANAGTYAALSIEAPEGSVVNAQSPAAVVAGNVETSQAIADAVLAALGQAVELPAQGQGTMNNLIIGGQGWTYYETIGGGQGASASGPGPSGVHVGMSNTLNTPIEALELEYPMRVERYELRDGSGGDGEHRGGDGVERAVRVLEPATLNLLTDRRRHAPEGREGGGDGACGENLLNDEELPPKAARELAEGDVVVVRTPGGGGYGSSRLARGAGDQAVPLVLDPEAALGHAADGERVDDRLARGGLLLGAGDRAEAAGGHHAAGERLLVVERERPANVEGVVGDEPGALRERLELALAPQLGRVDPAGRGRRREARDRVLHQAELEAVGAAPHLDHDRRARLGDAAGLAQRRDHVVGEEERVEAADGVERVVDVGEVHQVALAEVGLGDALARDLEQRRRGVEAADLRALVGGGAEEGAAAAADVEHDVAAGDAGAADRRLVGRQLLRLDGAPVAGARAPRGTAALRASGSREGHAGRLLAGRCKLRFIAIRYGT